jgi:hypothetical protein
MSGVIQWGEATYLGLVDVGIAFVDQAPRGGQMTFIDRDENGRKPFEGSFVNVGAAFLYQAANHSHVPLLGSDQQGRGASRRICLIDVGAELLDQQAANVK